MKKLLLTIAVLCALASNAFALGMQITEWMYDAGGVTSGGGEFVEFTNMGTTPIDFTGWSFDDDSRTPGSQILSAFGIVMPGESVILAEANADLFRLNWGLSSSVKIIGGLTHNLGRNDEINLYNALGELIDRLTYGDQNYPGTVRATGASCTIPVADLGYTTVRTIAQGWVLATVGDMYGSWKSNTGAIGNPGYYYAAPVVPEPGSIVALIAGMTGFVGLARRRKNS